MRAVHRADEIASVILERHGLWTDAARLQKLLYYVQAWHLAVTDEPLFHEKCKAWRDGQVVSQVWHDRKDKATRAAVNQGTSRVELDDLASPPSSAWSGRTRRRAPSASAARAHGCRRLSRRRRRVCRSWPRTRAPQCHQECRVAHGVEIPADDPAGRRWCRVSRRFGDGPGEAAPSRPRLVSSPTARWDEPRRAVHCPCR